jgi:hypothetical protein
MKQYLSKQEFLNHIVQIINYQKEIKMSRETIYNDERVSVIIGQDVLLGKFLQVF